MSNTTAFESHYTYYNNHRHNINIKVKLMFQSVNYNIVNLINNILHLYKYSFYIPLLKYQIYTKMFNVSEFRNKVISRLYQRIVLFDSEYYNDDYMYENPTNKKFASNNIEIERRKKNSYIDLRYNGIFINSKLYIMNVNNKFSTRFIKCVITYDKESIDMNVNDSMIHHKRHELINRNYLSHVMEHSILFNKHNLSSSHIKNIFNKSQIVIENNNCEPYLISDKTTIKFSNDLHQGFNFKCLV